MIFAAWLATAAAAYRAWRIVAVDDVTQPIRQRVFQTHDDGTFCSEHGRFRWAYRLLTCAWCSGSWTTFGVVAVAHIFIVDLSTGRVRSPGLFAVLVAGALSTAVGMLDGWARD